MLLQRELKSFIRNTLLASVLKQLPSQCSGSLSVTLKLDLTKTLRQGYAIGAFIIGDFPRFIKLVEECLLDGMTELKVTPPTYGVNISFTLGNCPLPRHNIESVEFLSAAFEQQRGVLVYLKDVRIVKAFQPELYLSSWEELWTGQCSCPTERQLARRKQSLLQIVQAKTQNIREAVKVEPPRCEMCSAKFKLIGVQDKYFRNCQRVRVMLTTRNIGKEELFQRGQVDILLDESQVERLTEGDVIDLCCYYSCEPRISKITPTGAISLRAECGLLLVSSYPCSSLSSHSNLFFSDLQGVSCEYIRCEDPRDEDTVCYNYKNLLRTVNIIRFPYLGENTLSTLKLIVINSLFSLVHKISLHFLAITDEVALLRQALQVAGVTIKQWPSLYDNPTLIQFLNSCHNCVLLVTNPTKKDFEYINSILNEQLLRGVNFALWVVTEPNPDLKKEVVLEKFQVVIDLSAQKNFNICRGVYDCMIDKKLDSLLEDVDQILMTVPRGKRKPQEVYDYSGENFEGVQCDEREMENENRAALHLLQRYFVRARQYKSISGSSLENIKHIAEGFAYFRSFLRQSGSASSQRPPINILDAILAIFIEEETSRTKFSSSNTLFSNEISKLMLNEGDCQLSFWEYEADEELGLGECKRMIGKDEMFKRMVGKLITLLYNNEVS